LFRDLDPLRWRQLNHSPVALLNEYPLEKLEDRANELALHSRINYAYRRLREYEEGEHTWAARRAGVLRARPVAYFSAEFGVH
jgi:starch phosphorylase